MGILKIRNVIVITCGVSITGLPTSVKERSSGIATITSRTASPSRRLPLRSSVFSARHISSSLIASLSPKRFFDAFSVWRFGRQARFSSFVRQFWEMSMIRSSFCSIVDYDEGIIWIIKKTHKVLNMIDSFQHVLLDVKTPKFLECFQTPKFSNAVRLKPKCGHSRIWLKVFNFLESFKMKK